MPDFIRSVLIAAPVEVVFAFHEREDALRLLSPPFPRVRVTESIGGSEPFRLPFLGTSFETLKALNFVPKLTVM